MFTTTDVYCAASEIGQELQLLIDEYGPVNLELLMVQIINVLEQLEQCINTSKNIQQNIKGLKQKHESLKVEKQEFLNSQEELTNNLEQLEKSLYNETQTLYYQASALEAENERLNLEIKQKSSTMTTSSSCNFEDREITFKPSVIRTIVEKGEALKNNAATKKPLKNANQETHAANLQLINLLKLGIVERAAEIRLLRKKLLQIDIALDASEEEVCRLAAHSGALQTHQTPQFHHMEEIQSEKSEILIKLCACEQRLKNLTKLFQQTKESNLPDLQFNEKSSESLLTQSRQMPLHISPGQGVESVETMPDSRDPDDQFLSVEELRKLFYERNELRCHLLKIEAKLKAIEHYNKEELLYGPIPVEPIEKLRPGFVSKESRIKSVFFNILRKISEKSTAS